MGAQEAALTDGDVTRNRDARRQKRVVTDTGMMADTAATPDENIVANGRERLQASVFQNETVVADQRVF